MKTLPQGKIMLRDTEVAEMLGITVGRVRRWRVDFKDYGILRGPKWEKYPRYVLYNRHDVELYMRSVQREHLEEHWNRKPTK